MPPLRLGLGQAFGRHTPSSPRNCRIGVSKRQPRDCLAGLLFAGLRGAQEQARRTQAKNDLTQIVTAVNAFYTEYGKYPIVTADTTITNTSVPSNADLFYSLRAVALGANALVNGVPAV